jgi:hypothetical protein
MPLAVGQELFFKTEWMPVMGAGVFNVSCAWEIGGDLDVSAVAESLRTAACRHDALRVRFVRDDDGVHQRVTDRVGCMRTVDLSHLGAAEARTEAQLIAHEEAVGPFEFSVGPLHRTLLLKLAPDSYILVCVFHHTIFDGTSFFIWQHDVTAFYRQLAAGSRPAVQPAPAYSVLVANQRERAVRHRPYWESLISRVPSRLDLPVAHREPMNVWRPEVVPLEIPLSAFDRLSRMCRELSITSFAGVFAAFATLIARSTHQEEVTMSVVFAGRTTPEAHNAVGLLSTDLYARADLGGNPPLSEFLSRVQSSIIDAIRHDPCPVDLMPLASDMPGINYFSRDSTADSRESFLDGALEVEALELAPNIDVVTPTAGTGGCLNMTLAETKDGLEGGLAYNYGRYERADVERFARRFELLLDAMPDYREARMSDVPLPGDDA